jgi:hypothetical protein
VPTRSSTASPRKVFPAERQEEYDSLAQGFREEFQPATPEQERLLDMMVHAAWNLRRLHELHEQLWQTLTQGEDGQPKSMAQAFLDDCKGPRSIDKLYRYERDLERSFYRAKSQFEGSTAPRPTGPQPRPPAQIQPAIRPFAPDPVLVPSPEIGFVSSSKPDASFNPAANPARSRFTLRGDESPALRL